MPNARTVLEGTLDAANNRVEGLPVGRDGADALAVGQALNATPVSNWYLDPSNSSGVASDSNDGLSPTTPLLNPEEHWIRVGPSILSTAPVVHVMSDIPSGRRLIIGGNVSYATGGGSVSYQGPMGAAQQLFAGTFTSVGVPNKTSGTVSGRPANSWWEVTDTSIPVSWSTAGPGGTSLIGNWIVIRDGIGQVRASGPVIADLGSKTALLGALGTTGLTRASYVSTDPGQIVNGYTYVVYRLTQVNAVYEVVGAYASVDFFGLDFGAQNFDGSSSNFITRFCCKWRGPYSKTTIGTDHQSYIEGTGGTILYGRASDFTQLTLKGGFLSVEASGVPMSGTPDEPASQSNIICYQSAGLIFESGTTCRIDADIGMLSSTGRAISVDNNTQVLHRGLLWGRDNIDQLFHVEDPGCWWFYNPDTPPIITTSLSASVATAIGTRLHDLAQIISDGGQAYSQGMGIVPMMT